VEEAARAGGERGGDDGSADEVLGRGKERGLICKGNEIIARSVCSRRAAEPDELRGEGAGVGGPGSTPQPGVGAQPCEPACPPCGSRSSCRRGCCIPPRGLGVICCPWGGLVPPSLLLYSSKPRLAPFGLC